MKSITVKWAAEHSLAVGLDPGYAGRCVSLMAKYSLLLLISDDCFLFLSRRQRWRTPGISINANINTWRVNASYQSAHLVIDILTKFLFWLQLNAVYVLLLKLNLSLSRSKLSKLEICCNSFYILNKIYSLPLTNELSAPQIETSFMQFYYWFDG